MSIEIPELILNWYSSNNWEPFSFQKEAWENYLNGKSGLIHATTGAGKTYAAYLGAIIEYISNNQSVIPAKLKNDLIDSTKEKLLGDKKANKTHAVTVHVNSKSEIDDVNDSAYKMQSGKIISLDNSSKKSNYISKGLQVLWITPLRALAEDTVKALTKPINEIGIPWNVQKRTGDTSSYTKQKQAKRLPEVLVTTPESLSLLFSYPGNTEKFNTLKLIVVDEWHELMSSKRGVFTELLLARLRSINPELRIWGLSATLGNTPDAMKTLLGSKSSEGVLIKGNVPKEIIFRTVIPDVVERFPWAGHLGTVLVDRVIKEIESAETSLVFTNTRSQTEIWFREILERKPDWAGLIALHHGSLDKEERNVVEDFLRQGKVKCVVCTSSLDLGVDFSPVDKVIQIGSPKGIARMLQRAGRSGHNPGRSSVIICVPSNSFDIIEFAAVRSAVEKNFIEPRGSLKNSLDVLSQHLVTIAAGEGFYYDDMFKEIKTTNSFADISKEEYDWVLYFITKGGPSLTAYPEYSKVVKQDDFYIVENKSIAKRHRMSIGTITGDTAVAIKFLKGARLGTIEEGFIAKLKRGDVFSFAGRTLEFVNIKDMTAHVRAAKSSNSIIPQWFGGKMPLSSELASEVRIKLNEARNGVYNSVEMQALKSLFELQKKWSALPSMEEILVEKNITREGYHLFIYPFEGKLVHEGLASLAAYRFGKLSPATFSISANDYGFELLSADEIQVNREILDIVFTPENLITDIFESLNASEMARRQFREIARIAGLIFQGYPGNNKPVKHLQASSTMFYEVFKKYDPDNLFIKQASNEVLQKQLEQTRLSRTLQRIKESNYLITEPGNPTPLAFPIMVNRFREKVSSVKLSDRIKKMQEKLEKASLK